MSAVRRLAAVVTGDKAGAFHPEREAIAQAERDSEAKLEAAENAVSASIDELRAAVDAGVSTDTAERRHEAASVKLTTARQLAGIQRVAFAARRDALAARIARHRVERLQGTLSPVLKDLAAAEDAVVAQLGQLSETFAARARVSAQADVIETRLTELGAPLEPRNRYRDLEAEAADSGRSHARPPTTPGF